MNTITLLRQGLEAGVRLQGEGTGRLIVSGPEPLAPLVDQLRQHTQAVLEAWEAFEERAAIIEYDGGLPRAEAERLAWECVCPRPVVSGAEEVRDA